MGMTPQYFYTITTSCAILPSTPCVLGGQVRYVQGWGVSSALDVYIVHVDVHGE